MSRSVGQPLADDAQQRPVRPLGVVDAQRDPVVEPEVELGEVAVEMLLVAMLLERIADQFAAS